MIYTIKEYAEKMKVSERTVRRWVADGAVKSIKIGGVRRIEVEEEK